MAYVADMHKVHADVAAKKMVGDGQCVALVHAVAIIPPTPAWREGVLVKGARDLVPGTIIATFDGDGRYGDHTNGTSHAAIFIAQTAQGIQVVDQWKAPASRPAHPPQPRIIHFRNGHGLKVNDGDQYHVVQ